MTFQLLCLFLIISFSHSFFDSKTPVILLNGDNFEREVIKTKDIWLILFYAPWCGHCQAFSPEYEKAAKALKGIFKIGAIDADKEKAIAGKYGIQGFPTIKFFGIHKDKPVDYNSARKAESVIDFMFEKARAISNARLGMKKTTNSNNNSGSQQKQQKQQQQQNQKTKEPGNEKDVIELTDDNFDKTVFNDENMWLIAFYAPWCGHCKKLLPEWTSAATQLRGTVKIAKVDATAHQKLAQRYQIQGYPTIKIFAPGKGDKKVEEYGGPRDSEGIVKYALDKLEKYGYIPETKQLINSNILKEECESRVGICVIVFLPHIADSSSKERKRYLDIIKDARKSNGGKPIYFLWAQGGDHFDFEDKLHLSFGYPAVIAVNYKKKMYSICRSSFSKENFISFLSNLLNGKEPLSKLPDGIKIKKVDSWDGKDYVPPKEDTDDL